MHVESIQRALQRVARNDPSVELSLAEALRQLDLAAHDKSLEIDPHFRHYLQKRSYVKALDALESTPEAIDGEKA